MNYTRLQPHISIRDVGAEKDFYVQLGFEVAYESQGFVAIGYGDSILFGLREDSSSDPERLAEQIYWQIGVQRVREVEDTCKARGLDIVQEPELQSWGEWIMKVRSPNGIVVGFEGDE